MIVSQPHFSNNHLVFHLTVIVFGFSILTIAYIFTILFLFSPNFNSLLGVWKIAQSRSFVFDILLLRSNIRQMF